MAKWSFHHTEAEFMGRLAEQGDIVITDTGHTLMLTEGRYLINLDNGEIVEQHLPFVTYGYRPVDCGQVIGLIKKENILLEVAYHGI